MLPHAVGVPVVKGKPVDDATREPSFAEQLRLEKEAQAGARLARNVKIAQTNTSSFMSLFREECKQAAHRDEATLTKIVRVDHWFEAMDARPHDFEAFKSIVLKVAQEHLDQMGFTTSSVALSTEAWRQSYEVGAATCYDIVDIRQIPNGRTRLTQMSYGEYLNGDALKVESLRLHADWSPVGAGADSNAPLMQNYSIESGLPTAESCCCVVM